MKRLLAYLLLVLGLGLVVNVNAKSKIVEKDYVTKKLSNLHGVKIFAYSSRGEVFWGSTYQINDKLQKGEITSSEGYTCKITSKVKKKKFKKYAITNYEPFKGKFTMKCSNSKNNAKGTWVQKNQYSVGIGKGSNKKGEDIKVYFAKSVVVLESALKNYFTNTNKIAKKEQSQTQVAKSQRLTNALEKRYGKSEPTQTQEVADIGKSVVSMSAGIKNLPIICKLLPVGKDRYNRSESYVLNYDQLKEFKDELIKNPKLILKENWINHEQQIKSKKLNCPEYSRKFKPYVKKSNKISKTYVSTLNSKIFSTLKEAELAQFYLYTFVKYSNLNTRYIDNDQEVTEKEVVWEVYAKIINTSYGFSKVTESYTLKKSKNAKINLIKTVKEVLKKCKKGWGLNYKGCAVTVIKYYEPNDPSKNRKLVNTSGINIEDVRVSWSGLESGAFFGEKKITEIAKKEPSQTQEVADIAKKEPSQTQEVADIAKKEPTIKPEDKQVEVAKTTQEEFIPKNMDIDNDPPVIEIAEAITVNDTDYEFQGKVTDKAETIYVEVDGRLVIVKKGKFTVKGYSPVDKQISIEAIDQWGNRSEPKIVKLTIDIKDTSVAEKLEPLNPSKIISESSNNKVALIIGIENYSEAPIANYANLDAKYFFDYAIKAFGVKKQNINLLINEDATFVKTSKAIKLWLRTKVTADQSDLIIFFAGHGLASTDGKDLYLLPQDGDPNLLDITALSRTKLFQTIVDLKPKSVTMFLDTCYSGVSRDEQMLLASARPIRIVADEQEGIPNNFTIFSATELDQISSGLKEANHGIFSYYLMKGLEGKADSNKDKQITNGELLAYMDQNVSQKAAELGRQQNPSLAGDPDKILMSYR